MKNYLTEFDETKVSVENHEELGDKYKYAWYDITDVLMKMISAENSALEYVSKAEMSLCGFDPERTDEAGQMKMIRDEFESRIKDDEYTRFMCCMDEKHRVGTYNDAGDIRLTFKNGSVIIFTNSEWGGMMFR